MKPAPTILAALCLCLASCASKTPAPPPPQPLLTAADHGKTVHLIIGETVDLELESNPTTGYSWNSQRLPEWKVVKQTRHAYQGPDNTGPGQGLVGASGKEHWQFLAVAEGRTGIDLIYRRAWEEPQETDQKLTIEFVVTKDGKTQAIPAPVAGATIGPDSLTPDTPSTSSTPPPGAATR